MTQFNERYKHTLYLFLVKLVMPVYNLQIKDHAVFFQDEESKDLNLDSLCCINVVRNLNKKLSTTNNPYAT